MRTAATGFLLPGFHNRDGGPGRSAIPVDRVDSLAEQEIAGKLAPIIPEARVIGEEACARDPELLNKVGRGTVWLVDPLDGTSNYRAGRYPFAMMVALVHDGETQEGWLLDVGSGRMCHARRGRGAHVDGEPITPASRSEGPIKGTLGTRYYPETMRSSVEERAATAIQATALPFCTGEQYARVGLGEDDVALFWNALPWDHAAGALWLEEAGGRVAHIEGSPYAPGTTRKGLLAAASPELWDEAAKLLFGSGAP